MTVRAVPPELVVADAAAWRAWLGENAATSDGVWLVLAKKGTEVPTALSYAEALEEALCSGWIDGRRNAVDQATYRQHFTPRRARSLWSKRNVDLVAGLIETGRMRERGQVEIDRAKADGRWDRAYGGPAALEVPPDLEAALAAAPEAAAAFAGLGRSARYPILHQVVTAPNATVRAARIARQVERLAGGVYPAG
ncbi:YdeI/OmpD-associated family protein [Arthrobacter gandavensis]|uniref:YdeI/OmpD-associated family protein n=1 Tax=Arthrobacter gandavensis TaxID=169960 RepID=UPI00188FC2E5|nr:YdeI/OmpD-associated family protein [Arthrobacter gandavensis]MBF4994425.1 YdeI/OmpD-associated family protein [Arthrobacter gandavensis]